MFPRNTVSFITYRAFFLSVVYVYSYKFYVLVIDINQVESDDVFNFQQNKYITSLFHMLFCIVFLELYSDLLQKL